MTLPHRSAASLSDIGQRRQPVGVSWLAIHALASNLCSRQNSGRICQIHVVGEQITGQFQSTSQDLPV